MTESEDHQMRKRQIALKDGRYLIFYTFEIAGDSQATEDTQTSLSTDDPGAKPTSERDV